jgi:hypothetical protein
MSMHNMHALSKEQKINIHKKLANYPASSYMTSLSLAETLSTRAEGSCQSLSAKVVKDLARRARRLALKLHTELLRTDQHLVLYTDSLFLHTGQLHTDLLDLDLNLPELLLPESAVHRASRDRKGSS